MTETTVDVNEVFAGEKRDQIAGAMQRVADNRQRIADYDAGLTQAKLDEKLAADVASGKIQMVGQDRYMVLTGYDANEVFSVQRASRPNELPLVLPEVGLDEVDGKLSLYSSVPAWHQLGNAVPGGTTDIDEVLGLGGMDHLVSQAPVLFVPSEFAGTTVNFPREVPNQFVTYREDTGAPLGVVGKDYGIIQNRESFEFLLELVGKGDALWESAGTSFGGARTFVTLRLPEDVVVDIEGVADVIRPFVVLFNSHDGSKKLTAAVTPWRPVCKNTERLALTGAHATWSVRHTKSAKSRTAEAARTLRLSTEYFGRYAAEETQLAQNDMLLDEFDALVKDIWEPKNPAEATKRSLTMEETRRGALVSRFRTEASRVGYTAYAAERAVTGYLDHDKARRSGLAGSADLTRITSALFGEDDSIKAAAHKKLMLRVR